MFCCSLVCMPADIWVEGNPLQPQPLVPLLLRLAKEQPPELRELGLDADQVWLSACPSVCLSVISKTGPFIMIRHVVIHSSPECGCVF